MEIENAFLKKVEALLRAQADGVAQVVILAAGMDARALRLPWHSDTTVYAVDQPHVINTKDERLGRERPRCRRVAVGVDLADDWPKVLHSQGFTPSSRTVLLTEGLLQYLDASDADKLFARVDALSASGSVLLYDVVGKTLLEAPFLQSTLEFMERLGAPWKFGGDTPAALVEHRGWTATVTDAAELETRWNRWGIQQFPPMCPGCPAATSSRRSRPSPSALVRWDRQVRAERDVGNVGGNPVVPLLVAHVGGDLVAQQLWCGVSGPQPYRLVGAAAGDAVSVRAERHTVDGVAMAGEWIGEGLPGIGVPQAHGLVDTAGS